jgi:DICT domain-containing protein/GAF domain-containing protein
MTVSLFRAIAGQYQDLRQLSTVSIMNTISHEIERQVIANGQPIDFFAGFQRFSNVPSQLRRYQELGAVCRRVYVFGVPDVQPPSIAGVEYIRLDPTSPLVREWFLVVNTPTFWTALLTQEVSGRDSISGGRRFDGVWSYDAGVIERAALLLSQQLGDIYNPVPVRDYASQGASIAQINGRLLARHETMTRTSKRRWTRLCTLQQVAEVVARSRTIANGEGALPTALRAVAQVLHTTFGAPEVALAFDPRQHHYQLVTAESDGSLGSVAIAAGRGPSGRALAEHEVVLVADAFRSGERDPVLPNARALIIAPIIGQQLHGVIAVGGDQDGVWNDEDAAAVRAVAHLAALCIEQERTINDAASQLHERVRRLEQALINLRQPLAQLRDLHELMRALDTLDPRLNAEQQAALQQAEQLTQGLAQALRVPAAVNGRERRATNNV